MLKCIPTLLVAFILCFTSWLQGQTNEFYQRLDEAIPKKHNKEFQFLAFFYNHAVNSNIYPENDFLKGQVIGRLYGQNTTSTADTLNSLYFEQRILPFFIYAPKLFNGKAILRASFEIDWTWGDVAYGSGGNLGSAPSGDQVNLQTQNIELELIPAKGWAVNLGLQRLYDTPYNPYRTFFEQLTNTSYRLMYWGTDGVGVSVRKDYDFARWKAGYYQLYENNIEEKDDVTLAEFTYEHQLGLAWRWGGSLYWVHDRANGEGGPSVLGLGLNSLLSDYNGTYRFPLAGNPYRSDIFWLGTYFGFNQDYMLNRFFLNGYANLNFGGVDINVNERWENRASILGLGANLRAGYRHGQTANDLVWLDVVYTTGDENGLADDQYSGVLTGNNWAAPGALYISHGGYLLFPHANVVNRYVAAVTDISNLGYGILGGTVNISKDLVPHKWNLKLGGATAVSQNAPNGGGRMMGTELNARLVYTLGPFMSIELHGAYLWQGEFFDSPAVNGGLESRPTNPYTSFLAFRWLMF